MRVTIENYTQMALRTWGGENQKERAELGIIGELGEVAEVLKKFLRGDFDEVERDKRLLKELGDLLYYIAVDMHLWNMDFSFDFCVGDDVLHRKFNHLRQDVFSYVESNVIDANDIALSFIGFCASYGFTLKQVMQANIDKLSSRSDRGKIQGDGSNR